jgi:hypothetical protein
MYADLKAIYDDVMNVAFDIVLQLKKVHYVA